MHSADGMNETGSTSLPLISGVRRVGISSLLLLYTQGQSMAGCSSSRILASSGFQSKLIRLVSLRIVRK